MWREVLSKISKLFIEPECVFSFYEYNCARECLYPCELCLGEFIDIREEEREDFQNIEKAFSLTKYIEPARSIVHNLKWNNSQLAKPIAYLIYKHFIKELQEYDYLVALPSWKSPERNWSPSELITKELSKLSGIEYLPELLSKEHKTELYKMSKAERIKMLKDSYIVSQDEQNLSGRLLIIDDLVASGLSLETCAGLIKDEYKDLSISAFTFSSSKE